MSTLHTRTPKVAVLDNRGLGIRDIVYHRHPDSPAVTGERIIRHTFDFRGNRLSSSDPRLYAAGLANFTYLTDLAGNVMRSQGVDNGTNTLLNDAAGRPLLTVTPDGVMQRVQYEPAGLPGRPISMTEQVTGQAARITERFVYAGRTDADKALNLAGACVSHYDTAGLIQTDSISLTGVPLSVTRYLLKDGDNPDVVTDWQGADASAWNDLLETEGFTTLATSDATGTTLTTTDAKGNRQRIACDVAGQLKGSWLTIKGGTEQAIVTSLTYSAAGQKLREEHGNGVVTTYTYEAETQRLTGIKTERPAGHPSGAKVLQDLRYEYDPVGNVLSVTNDAEETRFWRNQKVVPENRYTYDSLYQLVSATGREMANVGQQSHALPDVSLFDSVTYTCFTRTYDYDIGGNLTQIRHSAPATNNNYTTKITISERSNRGVLSTLTENPADVDALFTAGGQQKQLQPGQGLVWTTRNELQRVTPVSREGSADDRESYRYDGGSQRILKVSVQKTSSSVQTQRVLYLSELELRTTKSGSIATESLQVIKVGEAGRAQVQVLHWESGRPDSVGNDQLRYSYNNLTGSSSLELDGDGSIISMEGFYPFGGTAEWTARSAVEANYKTVRYSGKERDATGLYYYEYRCYQPLAGRWMSADPAGTVDGLNLYRMCRNNPVSLLDNNGLWPTLPSYTESDDAPLIALPGDSELHKNNVIPPIRDERASFHVKQDISTGTYETDNVRLLFRGRDGLNGTLRGAKGFKGDASGWRKVEAKVKNEIRVISKMERYVTTPDTLLFRGRDVSIAEYNEIIETGLLQNQGHAFFSNRHEVAEYFTSRGGREGYLPVIFRLRHNPRNADQYSYHKGRVDADSYGKIYGPKLSRHTPGLQEIIALAGNVYRVIPAPEEASTSGPQDNPKGWKGVVNKLLKSKKEKKSKYTYIDITPSAYMTSKIASRRYSAAI